MTYESCGNIASKSDLSPGIYTYGLSTKPFAVTGINSGNEAIPSADQVATYTSFEQVSTIEEDDYYATFTYNSDNQRCKMLITDLGSTILTRWYVGSRYIKETDESTTTEYTWIGGDAYSAPIVAETVGSTTSYYYLLRDYLGNITHKVNTSNTVTAEYSYDAWGRRRDKDDWSYTLSGEPDLTAGRGFTSHEYLACFNIVNMNGRLYDPLVGRFLSPDNFVQFPENTQSFNRYAYCINNPMLYTDPSGEFFIIDSWISGLLSGGWDEANQRAANYIKIWGGLFTSDPNKSFGGRIWEVFSRFTWQLPQNAGGFFTSHAFNTFGLKGGVESVNYKYGATVLRTNADNWGGITQGSYIVGDNSIRAKADNALFQHEYGHYLQSQSVGWFYYSKYGIPSIYNTIVDGYSDHSYHPTEQDANSRAFKYFSENVEGFNYVTSSGDNKSLWNSNENPISGYNWSLSYNDSGNQKALKKARLRLSWYDYALFPFNLSVVGIIVPGAVNSLIQQQNSF